VYGGRQSETPVGMIADKLDGVNYFEKCLAWNREGSVGYVFYHDHKFTTNDHHRPMVLKQEYEGQIDLFYIRRVLEQTLLSSDSFEWSKTASKEKIKEIEISIPINNDGEFDIELQKKISNRLDQYDVIKKALSDKITQISDMKLNF
jgi:restriction endonuclease S subunit